MKVLEQHFTSSQACAAACSMLRQMACSDSIKARILAAEGIKRAAVGISLHDNSAAVLEQTLGLIAALTLRSPEAASSAVHAGVADAVISVRSSLQGPLPACEAVCMI